MQTEKDRIIAYYQNPESMWGYSWFLWDSKHFGYRPEGKDSISEREAQVCYMEKVAECLYLKEGMKVLDAGCGRGVVACYLAKHYGAIVTGIDLVNFEIRKARRRASHLGLAGTVRFSVGDYMRTDFPDESFDAIYTNETLSHAPSVEFALKEFYRLLKPGGRLVLFEYTLAEDDNFTDAEMSSLDFVIQGSGMFGLKQFRHGKFPRVLAKMGFINIKDINITENVKQSFLRLNKIGRCWYWLVKLLGLRGKMINSVASVEFLPLIFNGLVRYSVFTAEKLS